MMSTRRRSKATSSTGRGRGKATRPSSADKRAADEEGESAVQRKFRQLSVEEQNVSLPPRHLYASRVYLSC